MAKTISRFSWTIAQSHHRYRSSSSSAGGSLSLPFPTPLPHRRFSLVSLSPLQPYRFLRSTHICSVRRKKTSDGNSGEPKPDLDKGTAAAGEKKREKDTAAAREVEVNKVAEDVVWVGLEVGKGPKAVGLDIGKSPKNILALLVNIFTFCLALLVTAYVTGYLSEAGKSSFLYNVHVKSKFLPVWALPIEKESKVKAAEMAVEAAKLATKMAEDLLPKAVDAAQTAAEAARVLAVARRR